MDPYHFMLTFLSFDGNLPGGMIPISFVDIGMISYLEMLGRANRSVLL